MTTSPAFDAWYRSLRGRVVASLTALVQDRELASECTDEAFARALMRWNRLTASGTPDGWVYRTALNHLWRVKRRQAIERRILPRSQPSTVTEMPDVEVWSAVAALPRRQREVVVLRYVADLPDNAVAEVLGIARGTVSSTLADAHRRLARLLEDPTISDQEVAR